MPDCRLVPSKAHVIICDLSCLAPRLAFLVITSISFLSFSSFYLENLQFTRVVKQDATSGPAFPSSCHFIPFLPFHGLDPHGVGLIPLTLQAPRLPCAFWVGFFFHHSIQTALVKTTSGFLVAKFPGTFQNVLFNLPLTFDPSHHFSFGKSLPAHHGCTALLGSLPAFLPLPLTALS